MVSAIVLAGGTSSRMGTKNKLLLPFNNKPAVLTVVETLLASGFADVIVVTGHEKELIEDALKMYDVRFTWNARFMEGMTTSIQQGVSVANGDGYMICLADMLLIRSDEYKFLVQTFEQQYLSDKACICLPEYKNATGNPVIFASAYREAIMRNTEPEGCKNIVQSNKGHVHLVKMDSPHVLRDFDHPEDYQKLLPVL